MCVILYRALHSPQFLFLFTFIPYYFCLICFCYFRLWIYSIWFYPSYMRVSFVLSLVVQVLIRRVVYGLTLRVYDLANMSWHSLVDENSCTIVARAIQLSVGALVLWTFLTLATLWLLICVANFSCVTADPDIIFIVTVLHKLPICCQGFVHYSHSGCCLLLLLPH